MPIELLQEKIKAIPAEYVGEVSDFIDFILQKSLSSSVKRNVKKFGIAKGQFSIPDNIDSCNDEIAEMFGVNGWKSYLTRTSLFGLFESSSPKQKQKE